MRGTNKTNNFKKAFVQNKELNFLCDCNIKRVTVSKKDISWHIIIESPYEVEENLINRLQEKCLNLYPFLQDISISFEVKLSKKYHTINQWFKNHKDDLFFWLRKEYPSIISSIPVEEWKIEDNILLFNVYSDIVLELIKNKNISSIIEYKIKDKIIEPFKIELILKNKPEVYKDLQSLKNKEIKKIEQSVSIENNKNIFSSNKTNNTSQGKACVIKGKPIKSNPMPMDEIRMESGSVTILGHVFGIESRLFNNDKGMIVFNITDLSNSITVKLFDKKEFINNITNLLDEDSYVKVRGDVQFDKYTKEMIIMAKDIQREIFHDRVDNSEKKRVELHTHSQFSAMDGTSSIQSIIKTAANWGHSAIAVTDHGVLQAYPDAMIAGEKNNIKIIYGVEGYLTDDEQSIVRGDCNEDFSQPFVVFDIETTGLSPEKDKITEIGAVKIIEGEVVERYNTLINPEQPIPPKIVDLTGITDEMVEKAPKINEVLPKFLDFCGNNIVVAHNAKFDVSFIKSNAKTLGFNMDNPVLDTLSFARASLPNLKRHRLNTLAKYFKVELKGHHRAVNDAEATGEILLKLIDIAKDKGANKIDDLNTLFRNKEAIKKLDTFHVIILVKNYTGLKNLYKLVSKSHLDYFYKKPRIPKSLLEKYREGLIIGSACEAGELYSAILRNAGEKELEKITSFYDYLEIQPIKNNHFLIEKGLIDNEERLRELNKKIVHLGENNKKLVVATCDVHFLNSHDEIYRRILMTGQGFQDADNQPPLYLRTTEEMKNEFKYLGEKKCEEVVVTNPNHIANQIEKILPIPKETFPPKIDGAEDDIYNMTMKKAYGIYGDPLPDIIQKRVEKELNSIISNGYAVLYLIAHKLVDKSLKDGYLVGSRGSVGSSLVATFTDITEVNPLPPHYICPKCKNSEFFDSNVVGVGHDLPNKNCPKCNEEYMKDGFDIPFEVFLGFEGDKEPDIDLNFSGDYQPIAHKYTEELFGTGYVYRAGTIGTIAEKTAYGFVKGYADEKELILHNAETKRLIKGCTGIKRTTGQHPGGIMVVPADKEIFDFTPIQRPADDQTTDIITTHFDYNSLSGRLLKLDILGHDDPTVIRMLEDLTGIDATKIPLDDKETMSIFTSTKALHIKKEDINSMVGSFGIPEFGTRFVRQMLEDTKPTAFADLVRISGLSHGTDVWLNNAQELIKNNTCSIKEVISTRDDIMVYLIYMGLEPKLAFKIMEKVRKGKGLNEEDIKEMKKKKVPQWYIDSCQKIKYMFPKAHAAAYVMMAFRIAYFKVHYPLAFYSTYFTVRTDDFDADLIVKGKMAIKAKIKELENKGNDITTKEKGLLTVLEIALEMYCRGFNILPVDLYKSHAEKFIIQEGSLLPPLNSLQGVGIKAAYNIMEARKLSDFISKEDLRERSKISKTVIEILEKHGCINDLPEQNQLSLF